MRTVPTLPGLGKAEVARQLGLSPGRIDQLMREGKIPFVWTSLGRLVPPEAVTEMKRERELQKEARMKTTGK